MKFSKSIFGIKDALCSKAVTLCFLGMGGLVIGTILAVAGIGSMLLAVLAAAYLITIFLWLTVSGFLEQRRITELEKLIEGLPQRYLLGEVLPKPVNNMERRYFRIMKEVSRSAVGEAEQAKREKEEYCDYVESWIHEVKTPLTACSLILDNMSGKKGGAGGEALSQDRERTEESEALFRDREETEGSGASSRDREETEGSGALSRDREEAEGSGALSRDRAETVRKLRRELKRADNLTESILYYARLRTAEKDVKIRKFSAAHAIHEAVKDQMELLMGAGISVETEGDFKVYSDEKSLCFILKQLLINCAKYAPGCQVHMKAENGTISVRDNGPGIPVHELPRVTERGFTGNRKMGFSVPGGYSGEIYPEGGADGMEGRKEMGGKSSGSTGMGLYIVKELCHRLGISLRIASEEGAFTCVTLLFDNAGLHISRNQKANFLTKP